MHFLHRIQRTALTGVLLAVVSSSCLGEPTTPAATAVADPIDGIPFLQRAQASVQESAYLLQRAGASVQDSVQVSVQHSSALLQRAGASVQDAIDQALDLLGIPYRRGGSSPEAGFDCSGFVGHVFREGIGLVLPRSSREMSQTGSSVDRRDLQPGDLVFFNTMRRAFSHVGIYLGNGQFVHAPRAGGRVRVEDMADSYWYKRYNGARRVESK